MQIIFGFIRLKKMNLILKYLNFNLVLKPQPLITNELHLKILTIAFSYLNFKCISNTCGSLKVGMQIIKPWSVKTY